MAKKDEYVRKTESFVQPIIDEMGLSLYDVEYVKEAGTNYLRIYADKEGGISINECEALSRRMNEILDSEDYIDDSYIFEVSSPGLGRTLKKDRHFEQSLGCEVEVKLFKEQDSQKEFTGYLEGYTDTTVTISMEDETEVVFERANIAKINLAVHF